MDIDNKEVLGINCGLLHEYIVISRIVKVIQEDMWHQGTQKFQWGNCYFLSDS